MTTRAGQNSAPAAPGDITEFDSWRGGTRIREFWISGVRVQVSAVDPEHDAAAAALITELHALAQVLTAPPPRETEWGDGQFDHVELGPGVRAALRVTAEGRVRLTIPRSDLDVTDGSAMLSLGLAEAGRRAAQIREQLLERARRRKTPPLCRRCGQSLFGFDSPPLCPAGPGLLDGGVLCEPEPGAQLSLGSAP